MSPRTLLRNAQDDLEQMREVMALFVEEESERRRLADARISHWNRLHVQITDSVRSAMREADDPAGLRVAS